MSEASKEAIKPCPFCGVEANIVPAPHGPRVYCNHTSGCLLQASLVYDFQWREWNKRNGEQQAINQACESKDQEIAQLKGTLETAVKGSFGAAEVMAKENAWLRQRSAALEALLERVAHFNAHIGGQFLATKCPSHCPRCAYEALKKEAGR